MTIRTRIGQCTGSVLPRSTPDRLSISGDVLEEINCILHGKCRINTSCDVVIAIYHLRNDFTTGRTEAMKRAKQFTQKFVFVVDLGGIANTDKTSTLFDECTECLLLFQREGNDGAVEDKNRLPG